MKRLLHYLLFIAICSFQVYSQNWTDTLYHGKNVVLEGRDIGSVVFPNAEHKFYLIADLEVRAKRRKIQMEKEGKSASLNDVIRSLSERDQTDMSRNHSPLIKAKDAIEIDTTDLSIDGQVDFIINIVNNN